VIPLTPIPSPPLRSRRHLHRTLIHLLVFASAIAGVVMAWRHLQAPTSFVGQVEIIQTVISSRDAGLLTNLWVHHP